LGFDWPKYALLEEYCIIEDGKIDLAKTLERVQASRTYYQKQLNEAFNFKMATGAGYSDFTDRFDEYARLHRELGIVISYLQEIIAASNAHAA
jgi:hypothetical protein